MKTEKITENRENKAQRIWVFSVRLIGLLVFIIPLIEPMYAYVVIGMEEIEFSKTRIILIVLGFAVCSSGKFIGIVNNNIGLVIKNAFKKMLT